MSTLDHGTPSFWSWRHCVAALQLFTMLTFALHGEPSAAYEFEIFEVSGEPITGSLGRAEGRVP